jgi:adenosylmethionine-8-amino-7-oxononanoate aminotransferase
LATFKVMEEEKTLDHVSVLQGQMEEHWQVLTQDFSSLKNIRACGAMIAADLDVDDPNLPSRLGYAIYREAVSRGALLRPLGNTLYWLPPLNTTKQELEQLFQITHASLKAVLS